MRCDPTRVSVNDAKTMVEKAGYRAIVIVGVRDDGRIDVVSYGATKQDCRVIGEWAQDDGLQENLSIVPFQTWFGWGNGGVPMKIPQDAYERLTPAVRTYVDRNTHPKAVVPEECSRHDGAEDVQ